MQRLEIEQLSRAVVPGAGHVDIEPLGAGLLCETYRVARDGVAYILKVATEDHLAAGLDPAWQVRLLERAGSVRVAPRLVYADLAGAVRVSRWVAGRAWSADEVKAAASLEKIAELLRRVHALSVPAPPEGVAPLQWIGIYTEALSKRGLKPDPALRTAALSRAEEWGTLPLPKAVVCHSDLHRMNVLQSHDSLLLLDWEYAHVADCFWDLAGWSANNDLGAEVQWSLLTHYLGSAPSSSQWQRFRALLWLYDYVCLLWSQLYVSLRRAAADGIAERARLLDARLRLPAHYAA
jgi:thiamine kinase-like enzyme